METNIWTSLSKDSTKWELVVLRKQNRALRIARLTKRPLWDQGRNKHCKYFSTLILFVFLGN